MMLEAVGLPVARTACVLLMAAQAAQGLILGKQAANAYPDHQFLTPTDLGNYSSAADCVEARKRDPTIVCASSTAVKSSFVGPLSPVNYPHFTDPICNAAGGFVCDPGQDGTTAMTDTQRANLTQRLVDLRNQDSSLVVCGRLQHDAVDSWHYQPFYLGVAVLPAWPVQSTSPDTLQSMGQLIMADWNMDELYVGEPQPFVRCPTTALLLIAPSTGQVFLSSPSCEFLCASNGGSEVAARAQAALREGGSRHRRVYGAAVAGAEEAYRQLALLHAKGTAAAAPPVATEATNISNLVQRIVFGVAVLALVAASVLGVVVLLVGPGLIARRGKLEC